MARQARPRIITLCGLPFPCYSTRRGSCEAPEGIEGDHTYCRRSANNILWLEPATGPLQGWRHVPAQPRWNFIDGRWRAHDASWQRVDEHRFWGVRHHVRWWRSDSGWAVGQAHQERWEGRLPRRHRVTGLDPARDLLAAAWDGETSHAFVPGTGRGGDGRVLVMA